MLQYGFSEHIIPWLGSYDLKEIIFIIEEEPEGGYIAKALGEAIFTQADTMDELRINIRDAVKCHFHDRKNCPKVIRLHSVQEEVIAL